MRLWNWWKLDKPKALPMRAIGAEDDDYTWEDWQRDAKEKHPVRYFFQETLPLRVRVHAIMPLEELFYWIRTHTYNRYHILDLRDEANGYKWGWIDRDRAMLHACFRLLCDYVENEMDSICYYSPATEHSPEWDKRDEEKEILELYNWWTKERPVETEDFDYFHPPLGLSEEEYKAWKCKDDVMLERLIAIRSQLWS